MPFTPASVTATVNSTAIRFDYDGCFVDDRNGTAAIAAGASASNADVSDITQCAEFCVTAIPGHSIYASIFAKACYCNPKSAHFTDNLVDFSTSNSACTATCDLPANGDASQQEYCGGSRDQNGTTQSLYSVYYGSSVASDQYMCDQGTCYNTDFSSDVENCGSGGNVCPPVEGGQATCISATCGGTCPSGSTLSSDGTACVQNASSAASTDSASSSVPAEAASSTVSSEPSSVISESPSSIPESSAPASDATQPSSAPASEASTEPSASVSVSNEPSVSISASNERSAPASDITESSAPVSSTENQSTPVDTSAPVVAPSTSASQDSAASDASVSAPAEQSTTTDSVTVTESTVTVTPTIISTEATTSDAASTDTASVPVESVPAGASDSASPAESTTTAGDAPSSPTTTTTAAPSASASAAPMTIVASNGTVYEVKPVGCYDASAGFTAQTVSQTSDSETSCASLCISVNPTYNTTGLSQSTCACATEASAFGVFSTSGCTERRKRANGFFSVSEITEAPAQPANSSGAISDSVSASATDSASDSVSNSASESASNSASDSASPTSNDSASFSDSQSAPASTASDSSAPIDSLSSTVSDVFNSASSAASDISSAIPSSVPSASVSGDVSTSGGVSASVSAPASDASTASGSDSLSGSNAASDSNSASASVSDSISATITSTTSSIASDSVSSPSSTTTSSAPPATATPLASYTSGNYVYNYKSCWGEPFDRSQRALPVQLANPSGKIDTCLAAAAAAGYQNVGLEYGGECWATNAAVTGGQIPDSYCTSPCSGDSTQLCGGAWALTLYKGTALQALNVPNHASPSATWKYQSCWGSPAQGRALQYELINSGATVEACLDAANNAGFTRAGLTAGGACFAATIDPYGGAIPESYCSTPCSAQPGQLCGSANDLSLYVSTAISRATVYDDQGGEWKYQTCWGEPAQGRALYQPIDNNQYKDAEHCLRQGTMQGFVYCGLEYGFECWCAYDAPYGGQIPESYCNMPCAGNSGELCGGSNTLSLYRRTL